MMAAHRWGIEGVFRFGDNTLFGVFDVPVITGQDMFLSNHPDIEFGTQDFIIRYGPIVTFEWSDAHTFGEFYPLVAGTK